MLWPVVWLHGVAFEGSVINHYCPRKDLASINGGGEGGECLSCLPSFIFEFSLKFYFFVFILSMCVYMIVCLFVCTRALVCTMWESVLSFHYMGSKD